MKKKISSMLFVLALGLFISGQAQAGTSTTNLQVSATKGVSCSVSTTPIDFGSFFTEIVDGSGTITVTCPPGLPYNIALDAGQNYNYGYRNLSNGSHIANYAIWLPGYGLGGPEWGDADFGGTYIYGSSVASTGDGNSQLHVVPASLAGDSYISDGHYTDVVGVTVHY
jgi:spore coat protein U-like protein